jgi:hypothetical protein
LFHHFLTTNHKKSEDGDEPTNLHHTSHSIHLTSFTISNRLYWIHLELVCCQVAHISIWSIGSPLYQLANEMNTVMDQRTSLLIKWWSNTSDGDMSYLTTDQFKVNSVKTVGNGERCEMYTTTCMVKWSSLFFVVGCQEMVKQKSKNVQRKTIHETKNWK